MRMILLASVLMMSGCGSSPMSVETRSAVDRAGTMAELQADSRKRECFRQGSRCVGEGAAGGL